MFSLLVLLSAAAQAAIVNVLTPSVGPPPEGFSEESRISWSLDRGNEDRQSMALSSGARLRRADHEGLLKASWERAFVDGETVTDRAFAHLRYRWTFHDPWTAFAFLQLDHNGFRSLLVRDLAGAGLELRLWRGAWSEAAAAASVMSEHEILEPGVVDEGGLRARGSFYALCAVSWQDRAVLASTTFYQPRLDQPADWRGLEELSLRLAVTSHLGWENAWRVEWDSRPPDGVESLDLSGRSGLVLKW